MRTTTELPANRPSNIEGLGCPGIAELLGGTPCRGSGALVMGGDPGVGKTALCSCAMGAAADMRLLVVRGVESEVDLPYAAGGAVCWGGSGRAIAGTAGAGGTCRSSLTRFNADGSLDRSFTVCLREPHRTRSLGRDNGESFVGAVLFPGTATDI